MIFHLEPARTRRAGFTLIELILVMTLLCLLTSIAMPSLSKFFRGREVQNEARQLLSLTHDAQSRAASEGFPMLLWFDSQGHAYGLTAETTVPEKSGAASPDPKEEDYTVSDKVQVDVLDGQAQLVAGRSLPAIRFMPDGTIDDLSPTEVRLIGLSGDVLWMIEATNKLSYAIRYSNK
jgi:type II secretion system protein H